MARSLPWSSVPRTSQKSVFLSALLKLSACGRWTLTSRSLPCVRPLARDTAGAHPCASHRAPCVLSSVRATRSTDRALGGWPQPCNPERTGGLSAKGGAGDQVPFISLAVVSRDIGAQTPFRPSSRPTIFLGVLCSIYTAPVSGVEVLCA